MSRMQSIWEQRTERKRGRERGTLVAAAACALGALYRFPAIYPPLFHLSSFSLSLLPQGYRTVTQGFVATGIAPCFQLHQNENFHFILPNAGERRGRKAEGRGISFICILFLYLYFQRIKISVDVDEENAYGSEYLVWWLLECKKGLNIFIHSCNKNFIFVGMQKSLSQF